MVMGAAATSCCGMVDVDNAIDDTLARATKASEHLENDRILRLVINL